MALIECYGDPREADVAIGNMPIGELVTLLRQIASDRGIKLGMTLGDVVRWQRECRGQSLPYLLAKRAAEDSSGNAVVPIIGMGTVVLAEGAGASLEDMIDVTPNPQSDQGDSEADAAVSDGEMSDGEENPDEC